MSFADDVLDQLALRFQDGFREGTGGRRVVLPFR
jgi:hypothetical protein